MKGFSRKIAVVFYGPPGAGKGTQADLLAKALNLAPFDIGSYLEAVVHDPQNRRDKFIQRQRQIFDGGKICDPAWVAKISGGRIRTIAKAGLGMVLSGALRTVLETFGKRTGGLIHILEQVYGRKNIFFFLLEVKSSTSLARNRIRLICSVCGRPVLTKYVKFRPTSCPLCGGALHRRTLDDPKVIRVRLQAFREETAPVFEKLRRRGYQIRVINGELAPYIVHKNIIKKLRQWLR